MPRMKDRQNFPPFGWQYTEPSVPGWVAPAGSFDAVVNAILQLRLGNKALTAQYNLPTDREVIANQLDEFNAQRCLSAGWTDFVENSASPPMPVFLSPQRLPRPAAVGVGTSLKRAAVGVATIRDWWLGDSLKPVDQALAEKRAATCVACPLNVEPNFLGKLAANVAETFKGLMAAKADMDLKTSLDDKLFSCSACGCWNPLKIWVGLPHIQKNMKPEEKLKLHASCWILHES